MQSKFTHLHVHSGYSFKYGTAKPEQLVKQAAEFGMSALALTDRDNMAGVIRFAQSCEGYGIKPIIGVQIPFLQNKHRVILLATADGGLAALYRLFSAVKLNDGLLTYELLQKNQTYASKLLIMHGAHSQLAYLISQRQIPQAQAYLSSIKEFFLDQALALTSHRIRGDGPYSTPFAARNLVFARENNVPAVITNSVRMLDATDGPLADVLDSARNLVPLHGRYVERRNSEGYLKSAAKMKQIADEIAQAAGEVNGNHLLRTSAQWAERSILDTRRDIGIGKIHLPEPQAVGAKNIEELNQILRQRCQSILPSRYFGDDLTIAQNRLSDEIATVAQLGFASYFLTVAQVVDIARAKGIRVAARGSGAGSLICHLLGISAVDPLAHGLIMERFCSALRNELPDIDIDVESARRLEIYDAVFAKFGTRVATVSMVETYRARHAIRDVGMALAIAPAEIDLIAKSLPHIRARNISAALENLPELKDLKLDTPILKTAIHLAQKLDGLPRHLSMHPCAVAISDLTLPDCAPIETNASGYPMVQFDKDDVEAIGFLKLDILGVRMQSAIAYSLNEIERTQNIKIEPDQIPLDDAKTFDLIASTRTLGVFQIESPGQRELIGKFAPSSFNDLIIDISLFRPGPVKSDMITPFLAARHGLRAPLIIHPKLDSIMAETEGVVVFHEQVIKLISIMTGISLAAADEKRRELGTLDGQQAVCDWFYPAAIANGFSLVVVQEIWQILRAFASFGFCKAHAAAFALPTYQSAWLKTHYTAAFLAGVLTHDPGMYPKRLILADAKQWGIKILPVDVNKSAATYTVELISLDKNNGLTTYQAPDLKSTGRKLQLPDARGFAIRVALSDIDGISEQEVSTIISARPYLDLSDFVRRSGASRPTAEALVALGGFADLHQNLNQRDLLLHLQDLYKLNYQPISQDQMVLALLPPPLAATGLPEITQSEKVTTELKLLGMDVSNHVLSFYGDFLNSIKAIRSSDVIMQRSGASVLVAGIKVALQTPPVRSGRRVMFLTLDDGYGCNDITFFEDIQRSCANLLRTSSLFLVRGVLRRTGPRGVSIRASEVWDLPSLYEQYKLEKTQQIKELTKEQIKEQSDDARVS